MKRLVLILALFLFVQNCCLAKATSAPSNKGYLGTLPVLTRKYNENTNNQNPKPEIKPSKNFNSENDLKPIPKDDPTFVNIILKKEKTSQYVNDLNEFIPLLEDISSLIEKDSNVQSFNAKVYFFNKNAEYFRDKYLNKPESQFVSYKRVLELSTHSKSIALIRLEAKKYNPYLASGNPDYIYNPNYISKQLEYLNDEIKQTILVIRDSE